MMSAEVLINTLLVDLVISLHSQVLTQVITAREAVVSTVVIAKQAREQTSKSWDVAVGGSPDMASKGVDPGK